LEALKAKGTIFRRVALRQCKYLHNVIEQDRRTVKKRVWLAKGHGTFQFKARGGRYKTLRQ
jgi:transposase-like protein